MRKIKTVLIGFNFLLLAACSNNAPVTGNQAGTMKKAAVVTVKEGTVVSTKSVAIIGQKGRAVGTVGSITGSILGSAVPVAGSIIGSMIGGAVGSEADKELSKQPGLEITLNLKDGEQVTVTQIANGKFNAGDKVKLTLRDNVAHVSHL